MARGKRTKSLDPDSRTQLLKRSQPVSLFPWPDGHRRPDCIVFGPIADVHAQTLWECRQEEDWSPANISVIAEYALCCCDVLRLRDMIEREGFITSKGRAHPAVSMLDMAVKRQLAYLRSLGLGGSGIDTRSMNSRRPIPQSAAKPASTTTAAADDVPAALRGFLQ